MDLPIRLRDTLPDMAHHQIGLEETVPLAEEVEVKTPPDPLQAAHMRSSKHLQEILASASCGCFYCLGAYPPSEIKEWIDAGQTAVCPRCGIDSVIGSASGLLVPGFLEAMHERWFTWGMRPRTLAEWTAAHDPTHPCVFDLLACTCQGNCNCHYERERLTRVG